MDVSERAPWQIALTDNPMGWNQGQGSTVVTTADILEKQHWQESRAFKKVHTLLPLLASTLKLQPRLPTPSSWSTL